MVNLDNYECDGQLDIFNYIDGCKNCVNNISGLCKITHKRVENVCDNFEKKKGE